MSERSLYDAYRFFQVAEETYWADYAKAQRKGFRAMRRTQRRIQRTAFWHGDFGVLTLLILIVALTFAIAYAWHSVN